MGPGTHYTTGLSVWLVAANASIDE